MHLLVAAMLGGLAGATHVVTGPDHLAAVAPLAVSNRHRAWATGLMWGIGHSSGTWALAVAALALRESMNVEAVSGWSERLVGVVLVAIGVWGLRRVVRSRRLAGMAAGASAEPHRQHSDCQHGHAHGVQSGARSAHPHGALGVGTVHGLAGTSHLLGVLPALALPTRSDAVGYVLAFGVGSIIAMTAFAALVGLIAKRTSRPGPSGGHLAMLAACLASIGVGVFWIVDAVRVA